MHLSIISLIALSTALASAKTDLTGCTRTDISSPAGASYAWIVPGTGELCDPLDCGGGRAPPKTTVPGCAAYVGTETYSASYLAGFTAPATTAASTSVVATSAAASATAAPTADASDDDEGDGEDDGGDEDEEPSGLADIGSDQQSTYVWRTADNPTATFNPFTASAFPSDVSTFWIPVDLGSTTSWEAAVPTLLANGYTDIVPASLPASSDLPAICAIATNSGCGINMSTMTISRSGSSTESPTFASAAASTSSLSRSAGVSRQSTSSVSGSASRSASASTQASTGAAGKLGCGVGGVGVVAAALGALIVM